MVRFLLFPKQRFREMKGQAQHDTALHPVIPSKAEESRGNETFGLFLSAAAIYFRN